MSIYAGTPKNKLHLRNLHSSSSYLQEQTKNQNQNKKHVVTNGGESGFRESTSSMRGTRKGVYQKNLKIYKTFPCAGPHYKKIGKKGIRTKAEFIR